LNERSEPLRRYRLYTELGDGSRSWMPLDAREMFIARLLPLAVADRGYLETSSDSQGRCIDILALALK
jgi:hypothetical protein